MFQSISSRLTALGVPLLAAAFLLSNPPQEVHAQSTTPTTCDATSLKGRYSIKFTGTAYDSQYYTYLLSEIGFMTFDGAGNFTGTDTYNFDGAATRRTLTGTYTINSDCTGSMTVNASDKSTMIGDIAVLLGTKEVNFTQTDAGWIFSGTLKFQNP